MKEISSLKVISDLEIVTVSGGIHDPKGCGLCCTGCSDLSDYRYVQCVNECEAKYEPDCKCSLI